MSLKQQLSKIIYFYCHDEYEIWGFVGALYASADDDHGGTYAVISREVVCPDGSGDSDSVTVSMSVISHMDSVWEIINDSIHPSSTDRPNITRTSSSQTGAF